MGKVVRINPFSVDYTNLEAVKELAKKLGNSSVIKVFPAIAAILRVSLFSRFNLFIILLCFFN